MLRYLFVCLIWQIAYPFHNKKVYHFKNYIGYVLFEKFKFFIKKVFLFSYDKYLNKKYFFQRNQISTTSNFMSNDFSPNNGLDP